MKPVCFAAVLPLALAPPAWAGDMDVAVAPFVWAPAMRGTLQEGPVVIPLDTSARDLAGGIRAGGMVHAEADADALHASVQAIYADFHDRSFARFLGLTSSPRCSR